MLGAPERAWVAAGGQGPWESPSEASLVFESGETIKQGQDGAGLCSASSSLTCFSLLSFLVALVASSGTQLGRAGASFPVCQRFFSGLEEWSPQKKPLHAKAEGEIPWAVFTGADEAI